jgi:hypothetical protein
MERILGALSHRDPLRRSLGAVGIALVLWFGAWVASYLFLAEGVLRELMSARIPDGIIHAGPGLGVTIFEWNLLFGVGAVIVGSFFAIGRISLGYFAPWWWALGYGVALGTNSFVVTVPGKIAPRIDVLWNHIGAPEMLAYLLVAAALAHIHMWRPRRWYDLKLARVRQIADIRLRASELGFVGGAIGLLFWTAHIEAAAVIAFLN